MWVDLGIGRGNVEFAFALCLVIHKKVLFFLKFCMGPNVQLKYCGKYAFTAFL